MRLFCFCIIGLWPTQAIYAEQLLKKNISSEQIDAATAKDLLLKYSLKQKEANKEARERYLYSGVNIAYPVIWVTDKYKYTNIGNRDKEGWQCSILLGGKLHRFLGELAMEVMQYPKYHLTSPSMKPEESKQFSTSMKSDKAQFSTSLEGMYLVVDQNSFQLFGLAGASYLSQVLLGNSAKLIPKLGVGIFWGNDSFGLVSKITVALRNRTHLNDFYQWSNPVTIHIGGRYIFDLS